MGYYYNASGEKILSYENIIIPSKVNGEKITKIYTKDFIRAKNLKSVVISEGIEEIGYKTFYGCSNLVNVQLPSTLKSIYSFAFAETGVTNINLPNRVDLKITSKDFDGGRTTRLKSGYAFGSCKNLININIPNGVTYIPEATFSGCTSLASISIPSNVTSINSSAFNGCSNLTEIIIEESSTLTVPTGKWGATNATITYK